MRRIEAGIQGKEEAVTYVLLCLFSFFHESWCHELQRRMSLATKQEETVKKRSSRRWRRRKREGG